MTARFAFRERDLINEAQNMALPSSTTRIHPLSTNWRKPNKQGSSVKPSNVVEENVVADPLSESTSQVMADPLTSDPLSAAPIEEGYIDVGDPLGMLGGDFVDPLRQSKKKIIAAAYTDTSTALNDHEVSAAPPGPASNATWRARKNHILQTYTVSENVQIKCSFLNANKAREDEGYLGDAKPRLPTVSGAKKQDERPQLDAKTQRRLDELEDPSKESDREFKMMGMKEYITHLENLNAELKVAWRNEERVKSLRIAIQCAKLLCDTSVAQFYPSMFVLVTEILDTFGALVFERIKKRSFDLSGSVVREDFTSEDIHPEAQETCRNWFFKVASIRDLVPRLYVEMALVPCYRFLTTKDHMTILARLSAMMRGVVGPLVSVYLRSYLGRVGAVVTQTMTLSLPQPDYLISSLFDFFQIFKRMEQSEDIRRRLLAQKIDYEEYVGLMAPALDWIMFCIGANSSKNTYNTILKKYCDSCNSAIVLHSIITSFPPSLLAPTAQGLIHLIKDTRTASMPQFWLFVTLGDQLNRAGSTEEEELRGPNGLTLLNEVWKVVSKYDDIVHYMSCAAPFVLYVLKYRRSKELGILLADILKHVKKAKQLDGCMDQLKRTVLSLVEHPACDFLEVMRTESFQKLLDCIKGSDRQEVYKAVMLKFANQEEERVIADAVLVHTLLHVSRSLHDSLDSLSFSDEQRQICDLIKSFISKISFGNDFEQQLNFYLECRGAFANMDGAKRHLVLLVLFLLMRTLNKVKGRHTKRTAAFAKACLAFAHITVPSLEGVMDRLRLYLACAQASLVNQFLPQTDTFVKTAISLIPEYTEVSKNEEGEDALVEYMQNLLAWMVVVPAHPEEGPLYLVSGVFNVAETLTWEKPESRIKVQTAILRVLGVAAQDKLPYVVANVVSNDALFAGDATLREEMVALANRVAESALTLVDPLTKTSRRTATPILLSLLSSILEAFTLTESVVPVAAELLNAAARTATTPQDKTLIQNTRLHISSSGSLQLLHSALRKLAG